MGLQIFLEIGDLGLFCLQLSLHTDSYMIQQAVQELKHQPHNKLCTWRLGANAYLIFIFHLIIKSQAQYKYSTWHLGANGYLIKLCSKDSSLLEPRFTYAKLDRFLRAIPIGFKNVQDQVPV